MEDKNNILCKTLKQIFDYKKIRSNVKKKYLVTKIRFFEDIEILFSSK